MLMVHPLAIAASSTVAANCSTGVVRLVSNTDDSKGRVEVCFSNVWGTICSNKFGSKEAQVICHQLGFPRQGQFINIQILHFYS